MILDYTDTRAAERVREILSGGDVFIYPTDTLYGLGTDAASETGISRIYAIKERPAHMPVSIIVRDTAAIGDYAFLGGTARLLADAFLPGALTLVLPAREHRLPAALYGEDGYLGFRIPDHPFCSMITEQYPHPLVSTSVNISGRPALHALEEMKARFRETVPLYIRDPERDAIKNPQGSTVLRIDKSEKLHLLREGSIPFAEIRDLIRRRS